MIDTHCHLDYLKDDSLENIINKSHAAGVEKIITISVEPSNFDLVQEITTRFPHVYGTQGIHPHEAKLANAQEYERMRNNIKKNTKIVAIGEFGLDYHYMHSPKDIQLRVFEEQFEMAIDLNMPIVIHTRDADEDTAMILKKYASRLKPRGVLHSFTSTIALAQVGLDEGFYISFNGIITFKAAEAVRDVLRLCPMEKILLETDAPFLAPIPFRGRENAPFYLEHIAAKVAEIKNISIDEVKKQTTENAKKLFRF
jgi:TatD DNase family protein